MRGEDEKQPSMVILMNPEDRIPRNHPLRAIRKYADEVLKEMDDLFDEMYGATGRPSIPPERLLCATLLRVLYGWEGPRVYRGAFPFLPSHPVTRNAINSSSSAPLIFPEPP